MNESEKRSMAETLSALADGEADRAAVAAVSARWRDDAELRTRWHGYQLIGDVMRSDELAGRGEDAGFLKRLRERLEHEPVVLAPQPAAERAVPRSLPAAARARRWRTPAAVAAGFMAVGGALIVMRAPVTPVAPQLAQVQPASAPVAVAFTAPVVAEAATPAPRVLVRDARLEQYFAAHQQFGGSTALGLPSAFLRNATFETPSAEAGAR